MESAKSVGRVTGVLVLAHLAAGLMAPFILLDRVRGSAGLFVNAAANPALVRTAVLLLFVGSAMALAIAIASFPVFRRYSWRVGMWLIALAAAAFSLQVVDNAGLMSLLSLSQEYGSAGPARAELLQAVGLVAAVTRRWSHYSYLLVVVSWIFLFFSVLYRFRLVPRLLATIGLITSLLQIAGVTLPVMLGYPPVMWLAIPEGPAYGGLALWLIVRGFDGRQQPVETDEHRSEVAATHK